jgi:hypothetical protein
MGIVFLMYFLRSSLFLEVCLTNFFKQKGFIMVLLYFIIIFGLLYSKNQEKLLLYILANVFNSNTSILYSPDSNLDT